MTDAIRTENLSKSYGSTHALDGLNLVVPQGRVTGFLGPNGAGKSTTIRILLGLLHADGGRAWLLERDPWRDAVELHRHIAYVPGDVALWPNLTGGEIIDVLGRLSGGIEPARKNEMIERFQLDPRKKAKTYSKGNRQKVALVAALATRVDLLILDEPTSGLDPLMEAEFQTCILEAKREGRSVLLSSHIFAEVEKLADTITIIRQGKTVESGTLDQLRHLTRTRVHAMFSKPYAGLAFLPGVHDLHTTAPDQPREAFDPSKPGMVGKPQEITFSVDHDRLGAILTAMTQLNPTELVIAPPSLEEIFLSQYADSPSANERQNVKEAAR